MMIMQYTSNKRDEIANAPTVHSTKMMGIKTVRLTRKTKSKGLTMNKPNNKILNVAIVVMATTS